MFTFNNCYKRITPADKPCLIGTDVNCQHQVQALAGTIKLDNNQMCGYWFQKLNKPGAGKWKVTLGMCNSNAL